MKRKITAILLTFIMLIALVSCSKKEENTDTPDTTGVVEDENISDEGDSINDEADATGDDDSTDDDDSSYEVDYANALNVIFSSGESGISAAYFMEENDALNTADRYNISIRSDVEEIGDAVLSGRADIASVPTSMAARLYNESEGNICIAAISTYSSLYMLENGSTVRSIYDLLGRTIYAPEDGTNTQYVLEHLLQKAGYDLNENIYVSYMDKDELVSQMISGKIELCVLDAVSAAKIMEESSATRNAFSVYDEWDSEIGSTLTQECIVVRTDTVSDEALASFLADYEKSVSYMSDGGNLDEAVSLAVTYGGVESERIAKAAIPECNFTFISSPDDMLDYLTGFYRILYMADPSSIGGSIPDDAFYR